MAVARKCPEELRELAIRLGRAILDSDECMTVSGSAEARNFDAPVPLVAALPMCLTECKPPPSRPAGGAQRLVRRRVLIAQLARLAERAVDTNPAALDAAARGVRLASRLEHNELAMVTRFRQRTQHEVLFSVAHLSRQVADRCGRGLGERSRSALSSSSGGLGQGLRIRSRRVTGKGSANVRLLVIVCVSFVGRPPRVLWLRPENSLRKGPCPLSLADGCPPGAGQPAARRPRATACRHQTFHVLSS